MSRSKNYIISGTDYFCQLQSISAAVLMPMAKDVTIKGEYASNRLQQRSPANVDGETTQLIR
ncbi:unnamed protein product [Callosobruchus maculatus]|uniref:Uncharacterized protein n=1 Tax=Callosobruchus maculatus TaxID=64391 RepID=A0A653DX33_CALMS|nr:unnamed protein product [Callosobruchus maculatus]